MKLKVNNNFVMSEYDNEVILVPVSNNVIDVNCVHLINRTGAVIIKLILEDVSLEEIISLMIEHGTTSPQIIRGEVCQYIDRLLKQGILVEA